MYLKTLTLPFRSAVRWIRARIHQATSKAFFASYSHKDVDTVKPLVSLLRITGAEVFRDQDSILPGKKWGLVLTESLQHADAVIVFWSRSAAASQEVQREYETAIRLQKDIIPVILDHSSLNETLQQYQHIDMGDFIPPPSDEFLRPERLLMPLADALAKRILLGQPTSSG
jgi:hypothetical protein